MTFDLDYSLIYLLLSQLFEVNYSEITLPFSFLTEVLCMCINSTALQVHKSRGLSFLFLMELQGYDMAWLAPV